jgi:hypothetical protein
MRPQKPQLPGMTMTGRAASTNQGGIFMAISKRLAVAISGAAFAGAAALTMGAATPAGAATTSAPATGQHVSLVSWFGCGWDCCDDCDWDCWDWC